MHQRKHTAHFPNNTTTKTNKREKKKTRNLILFLLNGCFITEASAKLKITMLRKHIKNRTSVTVKSTEDSTCHMLNSSKGIF